MPRKRSRARAGPPARSADDPALLPFLPLIYVAWSDGDLSTDEIAAVHDRLSSGSELEFGSRQRLARWLDPADPPSPGELQQVLATVRRLGASLPDADRGSLAELGAAIAFEPDAPVIRAVAALEVALGVDGAEATRELLGPLPEAHVEAAPLVSDAGIVRALQSLLDTPHADVRAALRARLSAPEFRYRYGLPSAEYRELVLEWLRLLARDGYGAVGYPVAYGGSGDLTRFLAVFETLASHDLSLVVKFGVQFGLFGGSIALLGTRRHHERYLRDVGTGALVGCFAMSELGHGSNVRDLATTARFDPERDEFEIRTPDEMARKEWIGNAAVHGRLATVFAQLEIGDARYGVHAFLVPIRDERGRPCPGVRIDDAGEKAGLNGVDNGRLRFDRVRVPRENLLDRYASVAPDGTYASPIASESRRFFTMLGTLVGGRISVAQAALTAAKSGLAIAVRYGAMRRQFGPAGGAEVPILDYPSHQRRLMPPLATCYAVDFALKDLVSRYAARTEEDARDVEALAAGLKAFSTWHTTATLQVCRECCGGQGYLAVNRIGLLGADTDVFTTFEGDNTVLLQLVARSLLTGYQRQFGELRFGTIVRHLTRRAAMRLTELNPIVTRMGDEGHLRDPDFQLGAFRYREDRLLVSAARRLRERVEEQEDPFDAQNEVQDHLVALARAHVERVVLERFHDAITTLPESPPRRLLALLRDLFALSHLERDEGWFLASGYVEGGKAKAIRRLVTRLCTEVRQQAVALVDAFGIPDALLAAPIAMAGAVETGGSAGEERTREPD